MTLQTVAVCLLPPVVPASIGQSAWAIALYALLYVMIWQFSTQSLVITLMLRLRKSEHLPVVASIVISAGVFLFVIGLLILMLVIPENTVPIIVVLTFFMAPWVGAMLIMSLKYSFRTTANYAILALFLILISGWVWALVVDKRVEEFFGEDTVLAELAYDYARVPGYDDPYLFSEPGIWQVTWVVNIGNTYCMRIQHLGWMRLPIHGLGWTDCFPIVLNNTTFDPGETDDPEHLQDRIFRARGTSDSWTEIQGLKWRDGALTLALDPYFPLTGLVLEFIDRGSFILTLFPSDATTDSDAGTLTWAVPEQPWQDGDSLTFRIRAERLPGDPAGP